MPSKSHLVVLATLVLLGAWLRLANLDTLALRGDEGYQALAVAGILDHGVPKLDTGFVYYRAPLFSYLQAAVAAATGSMDGFSLRLPAAVFGVLCIPAAWWLGRLLIGPAGGLILAAMITGSGWHVEMSRYARFYTALQLLFVLGAVLFYLGFYRRNVAAQVGFVVATVLAISFHDLGVMLGTLFLTVLPLRSFTVRRRLAYLGAAVAIAVWWVIYGRLAGAVFASLGEPMNWWADPTEALGSLLPLHIPAMQYLRENLHKAHVMGPVLLVPLPALMLLVWYAVRRRAGWSALAAASLVLAGVIHEMGLFVVLLILYLAIFVRSRADLRQRPLWIGIIAGAWALLLWGAFLLYVGIASSLSEAMYQMTRFPDFGRYYFYWLAHGWPVLLGLMLLGLILLGARAGREDLRDADKPNWFALGALLAPITIMGLLAWKFSEARYFFHLYPLMLISVTVTVVGAGQWLAGRTTAPQGVCIAGCAALVFVVSADLNPIAAASINRQTHATGKNPYRAVMNWPAHADVNPDPQQAAAYVLEHSAPDDVFVAVGPPHVAALYRWYLGQLDAQVGRLDNFVELIRGEGNGPYYPITGAQVIYEPQQLDALLNGTSGRTVWLLTDRRVMDEDARFLPEPLRQRLLERFAEPEFYARDGITAVARPRPR